MRVLTLVEVLVAFGARDGTIKGEVVMAYKPEIDLGGANQARSFIRDITSVGVGLLPYGFGTAVYWAAHRVG